MILRCTGFVMAFVNQECMEMNEPLMYNDIEYRRYKTAEETSSFIQLHTTLYGIRFSDNKGSQISSHLKVRKLQDAVIAVH